MKKIVLYPYLFAIFPVLFLYAHNIKETRLSQIFPALAVSLLFFFLLWGILLLIFKNKAKTGIVTTIFILIFSSYGHIYDQLGYLTSGLGFGVLGHIAAVPPFLLLWLVICRFVYRSQRNFNGGTGFLNIMAISLVLINIFNIVVFHINRAGTSHESPGFPLTLSREEVGTLPDVYYIILDEYAGLGSIKKIYNYDNRQFVAQLEQKGFYIAGKSKTRYAGSERSMAASLNMRFLEKSDDPYKMIQNSHAARLFKGLGYRVFIFPMNSRAVFNASDEVFEFVDTWFNDFNLTLLETSMLRFLADTIIESKNYGRYYRDKTIFIFNKLSQLPDMEGPKFVYAHIMCPHYPFVFNDDGGETKPGNFFNLKEKTYYLGQYIFVNKKVIEVVDMLLARSRNPPVIVIQSDHGNRGTTGFQRMDVGDLWQDIFNAYYLPGTGSKGLVPSISPVNTFRIIFNSYFKTNFPILKNE
jgi:hypothetical protein